MRLRWARFAGSLTIAWAISATSVVAAGPTDFRVLSGSLEQTPLAHWPDSIICRFPPVPATVGIDGLVHGNPKFYALIVRLTLAPAKDGLYYYGVGPIVDIMPEGDPKPNHNNGLKPGAVLAFRPDGSPSSTGQGECAGKSIEQLNAAGLTGR